MEMPILEEARKHALWFRSSKNEIYEWLTSEQHCNYSEEDARYALANLDIDYKQQALEEANYLATANVPGNSRRSILDLLTMKGFTQEETEYAMEHLDADFKKVALGCAEFDAVECHFSKEGIRQYLTAQGFTEEEVAYAMTNLSFADFKRNALYMAQWRLDEFHYPRKNIYQQLITRDLFSSEEAEYALAYLDEAIAAREKEHAACDADSNLNETDEGRCNRDSVDNFDENDFPEPYFEDLPMIPDPHTCMNNVLAYEELAQRARGCGRDELAAQYEEIAARWRYLFEEAEDEEMEW
jgi:SOS response regulatory protein OraA/RecX